jgi:hypothetical protein
VVATWQCDDCDIKRLDAVGITAEDWLDAGTSDTTMVTRLVTMLQESLAEMERLATLLDVHLRAYHDPHGAAMLLVPHPRA